MKELLAQNTQPVWKSIPKTGMDRRNRETKAAAIRIGRIMSRIQSLGIIE